MQLPSSVRLIMAKRSNEGNKYQGRRDGEKSHRACNDAAEEKRRGEGEQRREECGTFVQLSFTLWVEAVDCY